MILSVQERVQFQYILPVQGNIKTLELVDKITKKIFIKSESEDAKEFKFEIEELSFLRDYINLLDQNHKLRYESLSLIRKIMEETT